MGLTITGIRLVPLLAFDRECGWGIVSAVRPRLLAFRRLAGLFVRGVHSRPHNLFNEVAEVLLGTLFRTAFRRLPIQ